MFGLPIRKIFKSSMMRKFKKILGNFKKIQKKVEFWVSREIFKNKAKNKAKIFGKNLKKARNQISKFIYSNY